MKPTAQAPKNCSSGELAALADDCLLIDWRNRLATATARCRSYCWPPKTFTTRWPPTISSSTCVIAPVRCCTSRATRRSRRLKYRIVAATSGKATMEMSVSFQFSQNRKAEAAGDRERAAHRGRDRGRSRRRQLVRVEGEFRDQPPRRLRIVERRGQREQAIDHLPAQIEHHAMPGPRHAVLGHEGTQAAQEEDRDDGERQEQRRLRVRVLQLLDDRHDHVGHEHVAGGDDDHADDRQRKCPPVRADISKQAPIEEQAGRHG